MFLRKGVIGLFLLAYLYALEPVNLIVNPHLDEEVKRFDRFLEWDTLNFGYEEVKVGFPDSVDGHSLPYTYSIDTKEDVPDAGRGTRYLAQFIEVFLLPKHIDDLITFSWWHKVIYRKHEYDSVYEYDFCLGTPCNENFYSPQPGFFWAYAVDSSFVFEPASLWLLPPEEDTWVYYEGDIHKDMANKMFIWGDTVGSVIVVSEWRYRDGGMYGQKVYFDDIAITGWADYNRALTRIKTPST